MMASARSGATERTLRAREARGVHGNRIGQQDLLDRGRPGGARAPGPQSTPWVAAMRTLAAPESLHSRAASEIDPAVEIMSSIIRTLRPSTVTDDRADLRALGADATLVDDREVAAEAGGVAAGHLRGADVRRDDGQVLGRRSSRKCREKTGAA